MKTRDEGRSDAQPIRELPISNTEGVCSRCGGELKAEQQPEYRPTRFGIDGLVLVDVWALVCGACNAIKDVLIPNVPGLIAAVAVTRVKMPVKLGGKDIRFLRKALDLTSKELAERLEVKPETLSRWEHGDPIGPVYEKLLRLLVGIWLHAKAPLIRFDPAVIESRKITFRTAGEAPEMHFRTVPADEISDGSDEAWVKAA